MLLIYTPEDGPRQEFTYKPAKLLSVEAELLEECGGPSWSTYDEFVLRLSSDQLKAKRALLWIMLKRENHKLRFAELVVRADELNIGFDKDEEAEFRAQLAADESLSEDDRREALRMADLDPDDAPEPEGKDEADAESTDSP